MIHPALFPLRFEPFYRPHVWGGRRLSRYLGKRIPVSGPCGESWEVSDHPRHHSRLATTSRFGITLRQLMEQSASEILGTAASRYPVFPWLIKLLDADDWLSVQVHPDEALVKKFCPGEAAKTEAWYVLEATPQARIYAGLQPGVGPAELRQALQQGTIAECLHAFTPRPGDFIYLPAGTVHAVGGGVLFAEIQQTSDATFRLFDWNRHDARGQGRVLHVEEAFASIHWDQGPVVPKRASLTGLEQRQRLVCSPYFAIEALRGSELLSMGGTARLQALIVTAGQGRFDNGEFCMAGDVWIFPAAMPVHQLHVETPLAGLLCTLPDPGSSDPVTETPA